MPYNHVTLLGFSGITGTLHRGSDRNKNAIQYRYFRFELT